MATPKIIPYTVKLRSAVPDKIFGQPPVVYTNDLRSAEFQFKIIDMDASDLSTATAKTMLYMRDGSFFQNPSTDVSLVGNVFSYLLKENEGNHAGIAKIQLVVYFNEGLANEQNFPTQLYEFEIVNGLETKVAQEVMIYDWTTLTRDARAYIDQFVADEVFRDAQFENAQFDRNVAFGVEQTNRGTAFTDEQTDRNTAFTNDQDARALTFTESESGRTTAETGRVTAEEGRVTAETNRVTKEGQRVTAENNRVTAEGNRVTAESGRVTAESGRVTAETNRATAFTAFKTRLTAEETATANNKVSAVKGKTFTDVDARFEDVEFDTAMMGTNLVTNGDFSNGTTGWTSFGASTSVLNNEATMLASSQWGNVRTNIKMLTGNKYFVSALIKADSNATKLQINRTASIVIGTISHSGTNNYERLSGIMSTNDAVSYPSVSVSDYKASGWTNVYIKYIIIIDLTATFGKGNEPTAEQMDAIMAKFTNSWFDGTKNLFRASATLAKQIAIDARTEFEAKNEVVNGDFSNGVTGWTSVQFTVVSGEAYIANTISGTVGYQTGVLVPNHKHYISIKVRKMDTNQFKIYCGGSNVNAIQTYEIINKTISAIFDPLATNGNLAFFTANTEIYVDNIILIDLTATFGAGKEPTIAEMDRLMARFPNSWFDGVKPIQTIETLYQEKANKVQEAWIAPTLLNAWIKHDVDLVYMKDELGFVHLKGNVKNGSLNTVVFNLPAGYRPFATNRIPLGGDAFAKATLLSTGDVQINIGSGTFSFDGVNFKAER